MFLLRSHVKIQFCGELPWPRGSVLGLRPLGPKFRILCLEDSVISFISPSSGGSPGPVYATCAQTCLKPHLFHLGIELTGALYKRHCVVCKMKHYRHSERSQRLAGKSSAEGMCSTQRQRQSCLYSIQPTLIQSYLYQDKTHSLKHISVRLPF